MSLLSIDELKNLVEQAEQPCVSLYIPTVRAGSETMQNGIRFKNLVRQAEAQLENYEMRSTEIEEFLQPMRDLDIEEFWQNQNEGLAIFLAPGFLRYYKVPIALNELVVVSERFHLKPIMPLLTGDGKFFLLTLSEKEIHFFEGTRYSIREIQLEDLPTSLDEALQYDPTAKTGQFRISTSKGGTSSPMPQAGSFHGQGSPDQDEPQMELGQFFHAVDAGLHKYLVGQRAPLVLAGVERLRPSYREANTYANLVETEIIPIKDGVVNPEDLHQKAWAMVEPFYMQQKQAAIDHYHELTSTGKTSTQLEEAVSAAYYGRVDQLFVAVGVQTWGKFDPQNDEMQIHPERQPGDEDLLNAAAVQTILNGGMVYALPPNDVPDAAPVAAIFRY
ncbi:hypothetical protein H6F87_08235 [Cyanobacteria bacterium FACHB-502]|uniref:baeRF3 domain-containing protein n=2 Tax=Leptolyngbya TaxID=47251 RepID=UPI0016894BFC|nr:hypothetical protein [Cyanobacteria bacterium FACHB-502]MBD2027480.1 hypothetical protein [Leptolyngbya sp. FACHB-711]